MARRRGQKANTLAGLFLAGMMAVALLAAPADAAKDISIGRYKAYDEDMAICDQEKVACQKSKCESGPNGWCIEGLDDLEGCAGANPVDKEARAVEQEHCGMRCDDADVVAADLEKPEEERTCRENLILTRQFPKGQMVLAMQKGEKQCNGSSSRNVLAPSPPACLLAAVRLLPCPDVPGVTSRR